MVQVWVTTGPEGKSREQCSKTRVAVTSEHCSRCLLYLGHTRDHDLRGHKIGGDHEGPRLLALPLGVALAVTPEDLAL